MLNKFPPEVLHQLCFEVGKNDYDDLLRFYLCCQFLRRCEIRWLLLANKVVIDGDEHLWRSLFLEYYDMHPIVKGGHVRKTLHHRQHVLKMSRSGGEDMFAVQFPITDDDLARPFPVNAKEYTFMNHIYSLLGSHVQKNLKATVEYGVPDIFWKRSVNRFAGDELFGELRALLAPYTTEVKSVSPTDLLASYKIIFNSPGCPLFDEMDGRPNYEVVGSIYQFFRHHSLHNRLAKKLFEYAPKVDTPWNECKFAGKRYIAFWDLETLRQDIHMSVNTRYHELEITSPPEAIFDQLQWFQMPEHEPSFEEKEIEFRFRGRGEDSYVFLANGFMKLFPKSYDTFLNPTVESSLKYWKISFDKHYVDEQNGETLWHYEGCVLPNSVIVGRWSDGLSDPDEAVEGPMMFFPMD